MKIQLQPKRYESILFFLLMSGPPKLRVRDPNASLSYVIDWSVMLNVFIWVMGGLWVLWQFNRYFVFSHRLPPMEAHQKIALLFCGSLALSLFFSTAVGLSAYRILQIIIMVMFTHFWVERYGVRETLKHLYLSIVVLASVVIVFLLVSPDVVMVGHRLTGRVITSVGALSALGLILGFSTKVISNKLLHYGILFMFIVLLVLSMTRASYVAVGFVIVLSFLKSGYIGEYRKVLFALVLTVVLAVFFEWTPLMFEFVVRDVESLKTMSDRIPLWVHMIKALFEEFPLFGLGFYATREITMAYNPGLGTAHSAYVEVLTGGGLLSFFCFMLLIALTIKKAMVLFFKPDKENIGFSLIALFFGILLMGLTSSDSILATPVGFSFWLMVMLLPSWLMQTQKKTIL